ncbi:hypothetical protein HGM15179_018960 [Zosterops borbonicus]|uniref:Uncharacterized protein n=1 Tax=Zosterops borbonicus TaxID=364589 RepID=A0A8K1DA83_9PASS|nr:hypothetical protein HGM15179_018960 [Zosterops borbonicus]
MTPDSSKWIKLEITWGILKRLQQRAEMLMHGVGAAPTPENTFLAYLAIVDSNSTVRSQFCFLIIIPVVTAEKLDHGWRESEDSFQVESGAKEISREKLWIEIRCTADTLDKHRLKNYLGYQGNL